MCSLLIIPTTCKVSLRDWSVLALWTAARFRSCGSNLLSQRVTVFWRRINQSLRWPQKLMCLVWLPQQHLSLKFLTGVTLNEESREQCPISRTGGWRQYLAVQAIFKMHSYIKACRRMPCICLVGCWEVRCLPPISSQCSMAVLHSNPLT